MKSPYFSIVIPTYNRADFIGKTISSLLNQTFQDFEIIVVDNDSTDNTESLVKSITDHRISYYKKENKRQAVARNYGAQRATGEFINFFDSDDLAYPDHLQYAYDFIQKTPNISVFHQNYDEKDPEGNFAGTPTKINNINLQLLDGNLLAVTGVFIKKDVARKHPFCENQQLIGSEDYFLWLQLASRYTIYNNPVISTTYIHHQNNSIKNFSKESLIDRKKLMLELLKKDPKFNRYVGKHFDKLEASTYMYVALHLLLGNEKKGSIRYVINALKKRPLFITSRRFFVILLYLFNLK